MCEYFTPVKRIVYVCDKHKLHLRANLRQISEIITERHHMKHLSPTATSHFCKVYFKHENTCCHLPSQWLWLYSEDTWDVRNCWVTLKLICICLQHYRENSIWHMFWLTPPAISESYFEQIPHRLSFIWQMDEWINVWSWASSLSSQCSVHGGHSNHLRCPEPPCRNIQKIIQVKWNWWNR